LKCKVASVPEARWERACKSGDYIHLDDETARERCDCDASRKNCKSTPRCQPSDFVCTEKPDDSTGGSTPGQDEKCPSGEIYHCPSPDDDKVACGKGTTWRTVKGRTGCHDNAGVFKDPTCSNQ
jgi:hypothetical protein